MKKRWNIIFLIAVFILANVATFLFAAGRVKIIEKIVTVYKEATGGRVLSETGSAPTGAVAKSKVSDSKEAAKALSNICDFNDKDYLPGNEMETATAQQEEAKIASDNKVESEKDASKTDGSEKTAGHAADLQSGGPAINIPNTPLAPQTPEIRVADESIPMPQLPLCDTDFDAGGDNGGTENMAIPPLPDIS